MTSPQSPQSLPDSWSAVARAYLQHIVPGFKPGAEALCRYASIKQGDRVLDIACGPGTASFAALDMGAEVTGIDSAKGMVDLANEQTRSKKGSITFLEGDLQKLPVPDASFDVVISSFGVVFAPAPRHAVTEINRVLVPGGRFAFLAWPRTGAIGRYYDALDKHVPPAEGPDPHRWADLDQVKNWLGDAFGPLASTTVELPFTAKSAEAAWQTLRSSMGRVALAYGAMTPEKKTAIDKEMTDFFKGYKQPNGAIRWPRKAIMIRATKKAGRAASAGGGEISKSLVAILAGLLSGALLTRGIAGLASILQDPKPAPLSTAYLIAGLVGALVGGGVGGWIAARLAPNKPWYHLGGLAVLMAILSPPTRSSDYLATGGPHWALAGAVIVGVVVGGVVQLGLGGLRKGKGEGGEKGKGEKGKGK
ncbi:MAG TPA: methyltransferase domain-containing protein [Gemmatimonadales bacterium]|nr:methyltransferase domain-containing protein [Gemmatimonadales bacterium]